MHQTLFMKFAATPFFKAFLFALGYGCLFFLLQFFFTETLMLPVKPNAVNLRSWDVVFYDSIAHGGYKHNSDNTGFFVLFPLLWKISGLNIWGICLLNTLCFALGFAFLSRALSVTDKVMYLLWLTLPPVYFFFLPYTEALFFLLGAIILYAVKKERPVLLWISLFLISLVRPTASMLIPAFLAMELWGNTKQQVLKGLLKVAYLYVLPILLALALFVWWQYHETGIWFAYFKTQSTVWGHVFSWPGIPLTNIAGGDTRYHWLSCIAILVDLLALVFVLRCGITWLRRKVPQDKALVLSVAYLAMLLVNLLFMNPKYGNQTSNIMGANRHSLANPFFFLFLYHLTQIRYTKKHILYFFLFLNAFWILTGAYHSLGEWLGIAMIGNLVIMAFMFWRSAESYSWLAFALIAFNFFVQLHLFQQFITPLYVD